jgi:predicted aspartyl protease
VQICETAGYYRIKDGVYSGQFSGRKWVSFEVVLYSRCSAYMGIPMRLALIGALILTGLGGCGLPSGQVETGTKAVPAAKTAAQAEAKTPSQTKDSAPAKPKATAKAAAKPKTAVVAGKTPPPGSDNGATYRQALDRADSARSISQSAQNPEDWELTANRWEQALDLLDEVPAKDPNRKYVGQKQAEFNHGLAVARAKIEGSKVPVWVEPVVWADKAIDKGPKLEGAKDQRTYRVPIKYRSGKVPVVDVTFNGKYVFEMLVDTGATGTMITPEIAKALKLKDMGTTTIGTASGTAQVDVTVVNSITLGGNSIYDVPVTIGPMGLLGHDFFKDCDITIRRDVVEFAQCST